MKISKVVLGGQAFRIGLLLALFGASTQTSLANNLVHDFYLPMPEAQIYKANSTIISGTSSNIYSIFSIFVTSPGTRIYYDQWEDGYETALEQPAQLTTQVWGDGNDANGVPPGFVHDPVGLAANTVITLTNNVPYPRVPGNILWDAADHVAGTMPLMISRAAWPTTTGPVFAGAASVLSTRDYGTNYLSPLGQDMTNNLMKYVGVFIMAAQNNTVVTLDPNGNGVGVTNFVLNQGQSYLVNGGLKKGAKITASLPVQADLIIGRTGTAYASDWFTLYPVAKWSSAYNTAVGSAVNGQPAYVYLYNPNTNALAIACATKNGSSVVTVPATNVAQFLMPVSSGASFTSTNGQNFCAVCTVAALPSSDTAWNWGFSLVPGGALTTETDIGWGPGSSDGKVNGSPAWVTPLANTKIFVRYRNGTGLLTDPNGNQYDTNFTVTALQSLKVYDPSKDQTGMRLYTVDGTLLTGAWGEDPDVAGSGNPYIDAGTTALPLPMPVLTKSGLVITNGSAGALSAGAMIQYTVVLANLGVVPLQNAVVIDSPAATMTYLTNSTRLNGAAIPDGANGAFPLSSPGYTFPVVLSQATNTFTYQFRVVSINGSLSNSVAIAGTTIKANCVLTAPPVGGASATILFTTSNGVASPTYAVGNAVYLTMTNAAAAVPTNQLNSLLVTVVNTTNGDYESIVLTETALNSGVFRNLIGLPTATPTGIGLQDGTLHVNAGDGLSVAYTDPTFGNSCSATASIQVTVPQKQLYLSLNGSTNGTFALTRIDPVAYRHGAAASGIDIGPSTVISPFTNTLAVAVDASAFGLTAGTNQSLTMAHNTGGGSNRLMLVGVSFSNPQRSIAGGISNIVYGATSLSRLTKISAGGANVQSEIWYLTNPPAGNANVVVQMTNNTEEMIAGVMTFTNVDIASGNPFYSVSTNGSSSSSSTASVTVSALTNQLVYQLACWDQSTGGGNVSAFRITNSAGATLYWNTNTADFMLTAGGGVKSGPAGTISASVTNTFKINGSRHYATAAVAIKGAPTGVVTGGSSTGPATNVATFTQTPAFVQPFTILSNNLITITNYIVATNGQSNLAATNPAIIATLLTNGSSFLRLSNAVYASTSAGRTLVWSGSLSRNVTIPAGVAITYAISNGIAGLAFHVIYDGTNAPSKITLPTATAITISNLNIYTAPYPGGSTVSSATAGQPLYVRATVSDPFGNYDITSLGLRVSAPLTNYNVNTTLTNNYLVSGNTTNFEVFEYPLVTGSAVGDFNVVATANEGTEGVNANALATVNTVILDLGTPATTAFTAGNNGVVTNSYQANGTAWISVADQGANTNANTLQTLTATMVSSAGDQENIVLTETATNSGVFTGSSATSTNAVNGTNNGTLLAPLGAVLTATYSNAVGLATATATIQAPPGAAAAPSVLMINTIAAPVGGQALKGQTVTYNFQVINVGNTNLPNLTVSDAFPTNLTYLAASQAFSTIATNGGSSKTVTITWSNLGVLTPGQSTNLTVTLTAGVTGVFTNQATANAVTATNSATVSVSIYNPVVTVTKTLQTPTNSPVAVGSNVVFRIVVQNTGNTVVGSLPLQDTFSGSYYQYVSATIPPSSSGYGTLIWTNLLGTALATNTSVTNTITMKVIGQGNPANNTATVELAADTLGNALPTAASVVGVTTSAASIVGNVYNDLNYSGIYTNADPGISGVGLQLFTATNSTLVQQTTTDGNGQYQFLNLNLGNYLVVATPLAGYAASAPVNNQNSVSATNLTAVTNVNFLHYLPVVSAYSTLGGTVWSDANANGTNDLAETGVYDVTISLVQDLNTNGLADAGEPELANTATDTNGNYTFYNVTPGRYVIAAALFSGYYITGNTQGRTDNQLAFIAPTNGVVATNNHFAIRQLPVAENDANAAVYLSATTLYPLTNDISPYGENLFLTNVTAINGTVAINPGFTTLTFTPTNLAGGLITYAEVDEFGAVSSNATITVTVNTLADLAVGLTTAATASATSNLVCSVSVTNFGPTFASNVVLYAALPTNVTYVSASVSATNNAGLLTLALGNLALGAVTNVTFTVTAPADGSISNTVTVSSLSDDANLANNLSAAVTTVIASADLALALAVPANVIEPTNFVYNLTVTNNGPSIANSVIVTDTVPSNVTYVSAGNGGNYSAGTVSWNLGSLASGAATNVTFTVAATTVGNVTNAAAVTSVTGDARLTNNVTPPAITAVAAAADLVIGMSGPTAAMRMSSVDYTLSVTNLGPSSATVVMVTNTLPVNVTYVSASGGGSYNGSQVFWNLGELASGAVSNVILTVTFPATGSVTNRASAISHTADPNLANNVTAAMITLITTNLADVVTIMSGAPSIGATNNLVYTVSVSNLGPDTASSIVLTDALPVNVTFVSADSSGALSSGIVSWNLGDLASGASTNVTLTVKAPTDGIITNGATALANLSDPYPDNNTSAPVITTVAGLADISINVSAAASVSALSNLVYTISVTNRGPSQASSLVVTDTLPSNVTFGSADNGGVNNSGVVLWNLGTLANGASTNLTLTVLAPADGLITNSALASAVTTDSNATNNMATPFITTVAGLVDVAVGLAAADPVPATSNLVYTISLTNFGPSQANGLVVTDTLPVNVTFVSASHGGTNNSGLVTWTLASLSSGATTNLWLTVSAPADGTIANSVTVATLTSEVNPVNNTAATTTTVTGIADLALDQAAPVTVVAGDMFTYSISVTNLGPSVAGGVVVTDTLPASVVYVSDDSAGTLSEDGKGILWYIGDLASGETATINLTVTAITSGTAGNLANVAATVGDPNLSNNTSAVSMPTIAAGPVEATLSTLEAAPSIVSANGTNTATITVTLRDAYSNVVSGISVSLAKTSGAGTPTITTAQGTTDANGTAIFTVKSSTPATDIFTATDTTDGLTLTQTATVTFTTLLPSASVSTVTVSPTSVTANGTNAANITVTLKDLNTNPITGKVVTLVKTSGAGAPTITTVQGTTDANGVATFTVKSTTPATDVFTATDSSDNLVLTATATVNFTTVPASQLVFLTPAFTNTAGATSGVITVQRQDYFGNANTSDATLTVNLASSSASGRFYSADGVTLITSTNILNGASTASFMYANTVGGTAILTNFAAGLTSAVQTNTVTPAAAVFAGLQHFTRTYGTSLTVTGLVSGVGVYPTNGETVRVTINGSSTNVLIYGGNGAFTASLNSGTNPVAFSPYTISYAYGGDGSLTGVTNTATTLTTTPQTVQISSGVSALDKVYDGTNTATLTWNNVALTGLVTSDVGAVFVATNSYVARFATATVGNNQAVTVSGLILTGAAATNYTLTAPGLTANITNAPLTVTAGNQTKGYGATLALSSTNFATSGLVAGDLVSGVTLNSAGANAVAAVGNYAIIPSSASGIGLTNYTISYQNGNLAVGPTAASFVLTNLTQAYTGSPLSPTTLTQPPGLTVLFDYVLPYSPAPDNIYLQNSNNPTAVGIYLVVATLQDTNYTGSLTNLFTIAQAGGGYTNLQTVEGVGAFSGVIAGQVDVNTNGLVTAPNTTFSGGLSVQSWGYLNASNSIFRGAVSLTNGGTLACLGSQFAAPIEVNSGGTLISSASFFSNTIIIKEATLLDTNSVFMADVRLQTNGVARGFGSHYTAPVTVETGGFLRGTESVFDQLVLIQSGGYHWPGNSPGVQTFTGGLIYETDATLNWQLSANTVTGAGTLFDQVVVTGDALVINSGAQLDLLFTNALDNGTPATVDWTSSFWNTNHVWTVIEVDGAATSSGLLTLGAVGRDINGLAFTNVHSSATFRVLRSGNNIILGYTANAATVTLGNLTQTYDGTAKPITAITSPTNLLMDVTYDGSGNAPTNVGSYTVVGTVNDPSYVGSATNILTINQATATVTLGNLTQTYDGTAKSVSATTAPTNLPVSVTYNGLTTVPTNAGSYTVIGTISDSNYLGSVTDTLVIGKATTTVTLTNLSQTYDGTAKPITVITAPTNLPVTITYHGSANAPTNAGSYAVVVTVTSSNYLGSASSTLVISPATADVTISNLVQTYDGTAKPVSVITSPANLTVAVTYNGSTRAPTNAGNYTVIARAIGTNIIPNLPSVTFVIAPRIAPFVVVTNYIGSATNTLVISPATATVTISNLVQTYDGAAKPVSVTTAPANLLVNVTYDGSLNAPTNAGSYAVVGTISETNYVGTSTATLLVIDYRGDLAPPCWRGLTNSTYQQWAFSAANGPTNLAAERSANASGTALANVSTGDFSSGYFSTDPFLGAVQGIWDLGRSGTLTLQIPSPTNGANAYGYVQVQVMQFQDAFIYPTNAVIAVAGGTRVSQQSNTVLTNEYGGQWVVEKTIWRVPSGAVTVDLTGGYYGSLIDQVVVDTLGLDFPAAMDLTAPADAGQCSKAGVTWATPTVDGCVVTNVANTFAPGSIFAVGTNPVAYVIMDGLGGQQTNRFNVIVLDTQSPLVQTTNLTVTLDALGQVVITGDQVDFGSSDNCGIASRVVTPDTFNCADQGSNLVMLIVTDIHGNRATNTATVLVLDATAPVLTAGSFATYYATTNAAQAAAIAATTIGDNCDASLTVTARTVGSCTAVVTVTATDAAGNSASVNYSTRIDSQPPVLGAVTATNLDRNVLNNVATAWQGSVNFTVLASDDCSLAGPPTVTLANGNAVETATFVNESPGGTFNFTWNITASTDNGTWQATVIANDANYTTTNQFSVAVNKNQITGAVQLEDFVGSGTAHTRTVTFVATTNNPTSGTNMLKTWTLTLTNVSGDSFDYLLTDAPGQANGLSAKTAWNLRKKSLLIWDSQTQGTATFTGNKLLPGGDLNNDNMINFLDYSVLGLNFYTYNAVADVNGDGGVDYYDYFSLYLNWLTGGDPE